MAVVLVVNDDHALLETYDSLLREIGHQPITKLIIESGPAVVRDVGADAVVVDLQRPDAEQYGLTLIEELRGDPQTAALPIIVCTGAAEAVRPLRNRLEGWDIPVIVKPFEIQELESVLRSVLRSPPTDA